MGSKTGKAALTRDGQKRTRGRRRRTSAGALRLKLRIQLVPKRLWDQNLRKAIGKGRWDKLWRQLIKEDGARCAICEKTETLHGHEVWAYREKGAAGTAKLLRVQIICINCHDICHWGRTSKLFERGRITRDRYLFLRNYFRKVKACRQSVFDAHLAQCARVWLRRDNKQWRVDWGDFAPLVEEAEAARQKWAARKVARTSQDYSPDVGPGHHMRNRCVQCGAIGTLQLLESDIEGMSEGQEADYEAGLSGFAFCRICKATFFWET